MNRRLILGRDPALWLAAFQAALACLVGFKFDWLTAEQAALWLSLSNAGVAVFMAWLTRPIPVTVYTNALSIVVTLGAAYGLDVSQQLVAGLNFLVVSLATLWARGQISPAPYAHQTGVLGDKVTTEGNPGKRTY